ASKSAPLIIATARPIQRLFRDILFTLSWVRLGATSQARFNSQGSGDPEFRNDNQIKRPIALLFQWFAAETMTDRAERPHIPRGRVYLCGTPRSTEHFCTKV
ncbi:MAG TPA: hypothetical protein VIU65_08715, partial [Pyrinomonadaceae bacterium]